MEATNLLAASGPAPRAAGNGRKTRIAYWVVTGLLAALMLVDGLAGVLRLEGGPEVMQHLGYPLYFLTILGTAKMLGAAALVQPFSRPLKEWAYAGFTINFLSAAASWAFTDGAVAAVLVPGVPLAVLLASYYLWKKQDQGSARHSPFYSEQ